MAKVDNKGIFKKDEVAGEDHDAKIGKEGLQKLKKDDRSPGGE